MKEPLLNLELVKLHFALEIKVSKYIIYVKDARAGQAYNFSFFVVDDTKSIGLKSAGTFSQKETNEVMWSNSGVNY